MQKYFVQNTWNWISVRRLNVEICIKEVCLLKYYFESNLIFKWRYYRQQIFKQLNIMVPYVNIIGLCHSVPILWEIYIMRRKCHVMWLRFHFKHMLINELWLVFILIATNKLFYSTLKTLFRSWKKWLSVFFSTLCIVPDNLNYTYVACIIVIGKFRNEINCNRRFELEGFLIIDYIQRELVI